jgi:uncharacterized membrane protein
MNTFLGSRGGRILLLASLALNVTLLVVLGLSRATAPHHHGEGGPGSGSRIPGPWALRAALTDDRRAEIDPILGEHREPVRDAVRATREARREVNAVLRADPFDRGAFAAALARLRVQDAATAEAVHAMLVDTTAALTAEEREVLADRMWRRRGGEHRQRRGDGERPERTERRERP